MWILYVPYYTYYTRDDPDIDIIEQIYGKIISTTTQWSDECAH